MRTCPQSDNPNEKWCPGHKSFLNRSEFGKDKNQSSGLNYRCRQCHNKASRVYKATYRRKQGIPVKTDKHGMTDTPEYSSWAGAKARCANPKINCWSRYGGRGISMCREWMDSFLAFYLWMGPRPSPEHSIDRIDNDGNYEPGNVRWATLSEQINNTHRSKKYRESDNPNEKWCTGHKAFLDRSEFGKDKYQLSGLTYKCRQCLNQ